MGLRLVGTWGFDWGREKMGVEGRLRLIPLHSMIIDCSHCSAPISDDVGVSRSSLTRDWPRPLLTAVWVPWGDVCRVRLQWIICFETALRGRQNCLMPGT
jgi:hypothetical protein